MSSKLEVYQQSDPEQGGLTPEKQLGQRFVNYYKNAKPDSLRIIALEDCAFEGAAELLDKYDYPEKDPEAGEKLRLLRAGLSESKKNKVYEAEFQQAKRFESEIKSALAVQGATEFDQQKLVTELFFLSRLGFIQQA